MSKLTKIGLILAFSIFVLVFGIIKLASSGNPLDKTLNQSTSSVNVVSSSDWMKGNKEAKTVLIEFSDFQCPACGAYYQVVKQLNQEFKDKIQFVYRHFPLRQIHANADLAARSAEAAGKQNKFWEMHDMLFENQNKWSGEKNTKDIFIEYARSLNLDIEKFKNDLDSKEVKAKVENDYQDGVRFGVNATPTFFLNDTKLQNPRSYEEFKTLLEEAISKAQ
jgi:protein-disulfide isomerase